MVTRYLLRLSSRTAVAACIGACGALMVSISANAVPVLNVTLTSPATITNCTLDRRGDHAVTYPNPIGPLCISTAFQPTLADWNSTYIVGSFDGKAPTTETFQTTFTNWNVAQGANFGGMWALKNGGNLDVTLTVTDTAGAHPDLGGIDNFTINVALNPGYTGPTIDQLVWSQSLYVSYGTQPPFPVDLDPPANTLDTYSFSQGNSGSSGAFLRPCQAIPGQAPGPNNTTPAAIGPSQTVPNVLGYCDPIYPFQFAGAQFIDGPQAFWPDESFRAIALLSTVTFVTDAAGTITERDLTVYNGVNWGFDLAVVPEPSTWLMLATGLVGLLGYGWRRRKQHA